MDHYIQEKLTSLTEFLKRNYHRNNYNNDSPAALEADIVWDAARFWANVLFKGEFRALSLDLQGFQKFKSSYENSHNTTIDKEQIIKTHWLRNRLSFFKIPDAGSSGCMRFEPYPLYKKGFVFLFHFQGES